MRVGQAASASWRGCHTTIAYACCAVVGSPQSVGRNTTRPLLDWQPSLPAQASPPPRHRARSDCYSGSQLAATAAPNAADKCCNRSGSDPAPPAALPGSQSFCAPNRSSMLEHIPTHTHDCSSVASAGACSEPRRRSASRLLWIRLVCCEMSSVPATLR